MTEGFGKFLIPLGEWTPQPGALRSFELIAEQVVPEFSSARIPRQRGYDQVVNSNRASEPRARRQLRDSSRRECAVSVG